MRILIIFLLFLTSNTVKAGDLEEGISAFERGDIQSAIKFLKPEAEKGNSEFQYRLGLTYQWGKVPMDRNDAWKNPIEAFKWYKLAADKSHTLAQCSLGILYEEGVGVPKDYEKSALYYQQSLNNGGKNCAAKALANLYKEGKGVKVNLISSYVLYNIDNSFESNKHRDYLENRMTKEQVNEAQRISRKCIDSNYKNCNF